MQVQIHCTCRKMKKFYLVKMNYAKRQNYLHNQYCIKTLRKINSNLPWLVDNASKFASIF